MKLFIHKSVLLFCLILMSSCATMFHGSDKIVSFTTNSESKDFKVYKNGMQICNALPCMAKIPKGYSDHVITVEKKGYNPRQVLLDKKFDELFLLSLFFTSPVGPIVDLATGAINDYEQQGFVISTNDNHDITIIPSLKPYSTMPPMPPKQKMCNCTQMTSKREFKYTLKKGETCFSIRGTEKNPLFCKDIK